MYPGRSIWARGVLALGAGILLLSGLRWWSESTIRTKGSGGARSIRIDGSENDDPSILERSKESVSYLSKDVDDVLLWWQIEADRRWKRSARSDRRDEGSMFEDSSAETNVIHENQRASSLIDIGDRKIDGDGLLLRRNFRVNEAGDTLGESSKGDRHHIITRTDTRPIDINIVARISSETKQKRRLMEREGSRDKKDDDRETIDTATSLTLRNDRLEVEETGPKAGDSRSTLDVPKSREMSINVRSSDRRRSLDRDPDKSVQRQRDKIEENSRFSPGGRASILESLKGDKRSTWRFAAGMQEDQLLVFHENRERAESSATRPAEAIQDRKNLPEERDSARRRRHETSREGNLREFEVDNIENNDKNDVHETDLSINTEDRSQDVLFEDLNSSVNSEFRDESDNEESSGNASAFQILDSIIPSDNKRGKVTRGEDSKDLMVANNFVLASQDRRIDTGALIPEYRPIFARNKRKITRSFTKKIIRSIDRREDAQAYGGRSDNAGSTTIQKVERHETVISDRRKRHANHYSAQSVTPMAYVHIQPAYPAAPPTSRKCVRCMVVYKPCPSQPSRPPPRIVLPKYKYHKPASTWRGLKYGE